MTVIQRVAICFAAGVLGALAVVLFSYVMFALGLSEKLGVKAPISFKSPDIYRPLFWGGLWGIPFGLFIKTAWERLYSFGFLYFLAPVLALFLIFLPMSGAGGSGFGRAGRCSRSTCCWSICHSGSSPLWRQGRASGRSPEHPIPPDPATHSSTATPTASSSRGCFLP